MRLKQTVSFLFFIYLLGVSSPGQGTKVNNQEKKILAELLQAEDSRDEIQLVKLIAQLKTGMSEIAEQMAHAAGRIPSFKSWQILSKKYTHNRNVTDFLAIAARYPENGFPIEKVLEILKTFPLSAVMVETLLYLNIKEAFQYALSLKEFQPTVAANLWRSKDHLTPDILKSYYEKYPRATIYSIYRSRTTGIIKTGGISNLDLTNRYYGCLVCDHPEVFLKDPAWQVRISAVKASNSVAAATVLLDDPHELVRAAALQVYLKNNGNPMQINPDQLNPMQAEILASISKDKIVIKNIFDKTGLFSEVSAPFLSKQDLKLVMSSGLSDKAKIMFLENQWGKEKSVSYAKDIFQKNDSAFALQYLLYQQEGIDKEEIVRMARAKDKFNSELRDFGYFKPAPPRRPIIFYQALLSRITKYQGFEIKTEKGSIRCKFFLRAAPMTCFNFIILVEKQFFNHVYFHRVIPAFVSQDGDPSGTGSGGPGYSISCEYNQIKYDQGGRVGMALAGKDTGGSQYFITHLATPHLNHNYTIFAQVISGMELLAEICQYDRIKKIMLF